MLLRGGGGGQAPCAVVIDGIRWDEQGRDDRQRTEDARTKAMKQELEWVRKNAKGRQAKSKARLARFEELSDFEYQKRNETQEIFIPVAERLGSQVIEFHKCIYFPKR